MDSSNYAKFLTERDPVKKATLCIQADRTFESSIIYNTDSWTTFMRFVCDAIDDDVGQIGDALHVNDTLKQIIKKGGEHEMLRELFYVMQVKWRWDLICIFIDCPIFKEEMEKMKDVLEIVADDKYDDDMVFCLLTVHSSHRLQCLYHQHHVVFKESPG